MYEITSIYQYAKKYNTFQLHVWIMEYVTFIIYH
jgi:hypothetical protein